MKTSNANLDELRIQVGLMMQEGKDVEAIVKELFERPMAHIMQNDGNRYVLQVSEDQKSYQMRDHAGKVLDEKPLENHVLFLLQQVAISQFSELLLTTKLEELGERATKVEERMTGHEQRIAEVEQTAAELESKAKELEIVQTNLDASHIEREQEGRPLDLWTRIMFFTNIFSKEVERKIKDDLHMPTHVGGSMVQHARKAELRMVDGANDVSRLTSPIEIIIGGYHHTGKTILAVLMEKAFRDAGFNNIKLMNPEETLMVRAEILQQVMVGKESDQFSPQLFEKEIRISEAYVPRAARPMLDVTAHPSIVKE